MLGIIIVLINGGIGLMVLDLEELVVLPEHHKDKSDDKSKVEDDAVS